MATKISGCWLLFRSFGYENEVALIHTGDRPSLATKSRRRLSRLLVILREDGCENQLYRSSKSTRLSSRMATKTPRRIPCIPGHHPMATKTIRNWKPSEGPRKYQWATLSDPPNMARWATKTGENMRDITRSQPVILTFGWPRKHLQHFLISLRKITTAHVDYEKS